MAIPRANVTEVNGEISCSIEETNRIRAQLGLAPLRDTMASAAAAPVRSSNVGGSESNEISLSVEETNKLRESLGLAPLRTGPSTDVAGSSNAPIAVDPGADGEPDEDQKRQEAAARRAAARLEARPEAKMSLGAALLSSKGGKGVDGVVGKPMAGRKRRLEDASENVGGGKRAATGASMRIGHDAEELEAGKSLVMTLADRGILDDEDDEEEVLQEEGLVAKQRAKVLETKRKRASKPMYSGVEDDDEEDLLDARLGGTKILGQYDQDRPSERLGPRRGGIRLGADGKARIQVELSDAKEEEAEDAGIVIGGGGGKGGEGGYATLDTANEYEDVFAVVDKSEKKKKKSKKSKKSKKKHIFRGEEDLEEDFEGGDAKKRGFEGGDAKKRGFEGDTSKTYKESDLVAELEDAAAADGVQVVQRGGGAAERAALEEEMAAARARQAYSAASDRIASKAEALLKGGESSGGGGDGERRVGGIVRGGSGIRHVQASTVSGQRVYRFTKEDADHMRREAEAADRGGSGVQEEEEDEAALFESIARARKASKPPTAPAYVAEAEEDSGSSSDEDDQGAVAIAKRIRGGGGGGGGTTGGVVMAQSSKKSTLRLRDVDIFAQRVKMAHDEEQQHSAAQRQSSASPTDNEPTSAWTEDALPQPSTTSEKADHSADETAPTVQETASKPTGGAAAALAHFRRIGEIGKRRVAAVGRANDSAFEEDHSTIQLSYLDETGRPQTKEEAYRDLSRQFHGHAPSRSRQERKLLKQLEEEAARQGKGEQIRKLRDQAKRHGYVTLDRK